MFTNALPMELPKYLPLDKFLELWDNSLTVRIPDISTISRASPDHKTRQYSTPTWKFSSIYFDEISTRRSTCDGKFLLRYVYSRQMFICLSNHRNVGNPTQAIDVVHHSSRLEYPQDPRQGMGSLGDFSHST